MAQKEDITRKGEESIREAAEKESPAYRTEKPGEPRRTGEGQPEERTAPPQEGVPERR